jgi:hypothetical protein
LGVLLKTEHLRGDKIGFQLFPFPTFSPSERAAVYQEMNRRAGDSLRAGKHVVYDAAVNTAAQRDALERLAQINGGRAIGMWVRVPTDLAKRRAGKARDSGIGQPVARIIPPHIFDQYVAAFENPQRGEPVVILPGDQSFYYQYSRLRRILFRARIAKLPPLVSP